jgi:DNA-binding MarR family transcriptional regulator
MNDLPTQHLEAWRLLLTAHARLIAAVDARLSAEDRIPLQSYDVLIELYEAQNRSLRMSDLAQRVLLSRSGLTRLVDRLENEGLLRREIDPQDRRGFFAVLTDAGLAAMRAAWPVYQAGIVEHFARHLSDDDAAALARMLSRMIPDRS